MTATRALTAIIALSMLLATGESLAGRINSADPNGTFHSVYCPELAKHLSRAQLDYACSPSSGTGENINRVARNPRELGLGQLDAFLPAAVRLEDREAVTEVRLDDFRQCLFAVTRHRDLRSYGELAVLAPHLRFFLPPQSSNSSETFRNLQKADPKGLGAVTSVQHTGSAEDAVRLALSADDAVAFFVGFPDPENLRFKLVRSLGGHFVPIVDRGILRQTLDGRKIYFAQETQVANADWLARGQRLVTACTPMVLFTGTPARIADEKARQDHEDMIATVRALKPGSLLPQESTFSRALKRTKELSASSAEHLMKASEQARDKARPYIDRAKDTADKALEAAKPALERAKEYGIKAYERAREELKELMAPSKPDDASPTTPPKQ